MIPTALLCVVVSGCVDQQPIGPEFRPVVRTDNVVPFNKYFLAWSRGYSSAPIETQIFATDIRQERQYAEWFPDESDLAFARANPGRLYIAGDEPDQYCILAEDYAVYFYEFVRRMRDADPTARFSPAGFAEPNGHCCPDPADTACQERMHSVSYADRFYHAYLQRYGAPPPVAEWRFHDFALVFADGDMAGWWARVDSRAAWSVAHGANMVLGGWGFHGWDVPVPEYQEYMKQAMGRLLRDSRINGAVYWSYEPWIHSPRPLVNEAGSLTAEGQTYVNPLTDVPAGVVVDLSENGHANLRWTNTTSAWAAEAEFWVQPHGSNSFSYARTELLSGPGANQTPSFGFHAGDVVKGRVRYYNVHGQAGWSSFSNAVLIEGGKKRSPLPCFGSRRIQSQPCG